MKKIVLSILILGMVLGPMREALALRIPVGLQRPNILLHADVITALGRGKKSIFALADRWSIAGKFNDVVIFLESLNSGDSDIQNYLAITREKINALKTCKDLEKKGFIPIIVPDGKGGFFVDTLGFEGKWVLRNTTEEVIDNGYKLRALKSISIAIAETRSRSLVSIDSFGSVYVVGDVKSIEQAFHPHPDIAIKNQWTGTEETVIYVTPSFMKMDMMAQRDILRNALKFTGYYYSIAKSISFGYGTFSAEKEEILETGPVQLVSLNEVSNIGVNLLGQALEKKRIGAQCNFFTDEEKDNILSERASGVELNGSESDESILRKYEAMFRKAILEMKQKSSRIICISVTTSMLDKTNLFIEMVKKEMPDSIVILGGPMASTPEQLGALIPKADVVVRGEADKVFPELVDILKKCKDSQDLTEEQIKELLALPGGIFVRIGPAFIVNNLHKSNRVDYPNLQKPRDRKRDNILFSSRGCPYDCWFCSQPFGNKFRPVSNGEIVKWLITRLELEFRERKDVNINFFLKEGRDLFQYGLAEPIDIEIYDDNFFLDKNRIKDLCRRIKALGMDRYFHFDIMGGSIRAFYKNGKIDTELADNLWDAGFRDIVFGTDGLSNAILEQNNKGYGFDEVIALNKYLREKGFLVQNAFICSTPQASYLEFFENMFLSAVSTNISLLSGNPGIIGDQATSFGKLDALNFAEKYIWEGNRPMDKVYEDKEGYLVPKQPEYAYRKHTLLHVMDAGV